MKSEKGMSHIMLFICIIIIVVFIGAIVYFVQTKYEEEKLATIKTNMLLLEGKIKVLSEEIIMKKEGYTYIGKKLSENSEDSDVKKLIDENIINVEDENYNEYYILESENFEQLGLVDYELEKLIVNYKTCEIIYTNGFIINEKIYYKLSDFES